jgi:hypothetical protein
MRSRPMEGAPWLTAAMDRWSAVPGSDLIAAQHRRCFLFAAWLGSLQAGDSHLMAGILDAIFAAKVKLLPVNEAGFGGQIAKSELKRGLLDALVTFGAEQRSLDRDRAMAALLADARSDLFVRSARCVWDALQLDRALSKSDAATCEGLLTTQAAIEFVGTRSHVCFANDADVRDLRTYGLHRQFKSFCNQMLADCRQRSIPSWRAAFSAPSTPGFLDPELPRVVDAVVGAGEVAQFDMTAIAADLRLRHGVADLLRAFVLKGFVLHGSQRKIDGPLVPHQGSCLSGRPSGNVSGIYVTRHPETTLFRATRYAGLNEWAGPDHPWAKRVFAGDAALVEHRPTRGYVYVIRYPDTLPANRREPPAIRSACLPIARIPVNGDDFQQTIELIPEIEAAFIVMVGQAFQRLGPAR